MLDSSQEPRRIRSDCSTSGRVPRFRWYRAHGESQGTRPMMTGRSDAVIPERRSSSHSGSPGEQRSLGIGSHLLLKVLHLVIEAIQVRPQTFDEVYQVVVRVMLLRDAIHVVAVVPVIRHRTGSRRAAAPHTGWGLRSCRAKGTLRTVRAVPRSA